MRARRSVPRAGVSKRRRRPGGLLGAAHGARRWQEEREGRAHRREVAAGAWRQGRISGRWSTATGRVAGGWSAAAVAWPVGGARRRSHGREVERGGGGRVAGRWSAAVAVAWPRGGARRRRLRGRGEEPGGGRVVGRRSAAAGAWPGGGAGRRQGGGGRRRLARGSRRGLRRGLTRSTGGISLVIRREFFFSLLFSARCTGSQKQIASSYIVRIVT